MIHRPHCQWLITFFALSGLVNAQEKDFHLKLNLDPLLEITKVWTLDGGALEQQFTEPNFRENPFLHWSDDKLTGILASAVLQHHR